MTIEENIILAFNDNTRLVNLRKKFDVCGILALSFRPQLQVGPVLPQPSPSTHPPALQAPDWIQQLMPFEGKEHSMLG